MFAIRLKNDFNLINSLLLLYNLYYFDAMKEQQYSYILLFESILYIFGEYLN